MLTAEIFCLGNELLIGRTINRNAAEIALELTKIGFTVTRETSVRDEFSAAKTALDEILSRKPSVVVITGGLGPTHDDIQLSVVASSLGVDLKMSEKAVKMLETRYGRNRNEIDKNQLKMAQLPEGASPLKNNEGSAPGSMIIYNKSLIFCLPGVPREMRAILLDHVIPQLISHYKPSKKTFEFGFSVYNIGESKLSELTEKVRNKYPSIGFKTHPKKDGDMYWVQLHVYTIDNNDELARHAINEWYDEIKNKYSPKMTEIAPVFVKDYRSE